MLRPAVEFLPRTLSGTFLEDPALIEISRLSDSGGMTRVEILLVIAYFIEPRGFAVYWEDLDDGIELNHLLSMQPIF